MKRVMRHPAAQAALAALVGRYLEFALRTTRWTMVGEEHIAATARVGATIAAFWHERLPLMPALWLHVRRAGGLERAAAHVLVSRHRDGRFIGAVVRRFALAAVHGSTFRNGRDRGGAAGLRAMLGVLETGGHAIITPDGPRGPRRVAASGVAQLAAVSGCPVLPCGAQTRRRRVLPTWDRMVLPLPWGRGVIVCGPPIRVARDAAEAMLPAIAAALTEAVERADALCGGGATP